MFLRFDEVAAQVILVGPAGGGGDEEEAFVVQAAATLHDGEAFGIETEGGFAGGQFGGIEFIRAGESCGKANDAGLARFPPVGGGGGGDAEGEDQTHDGKGGGGSGPTAL